MKIALLQQNYTVGDVEGNAQKIISASHAAASHSVDLIITSELSLMGYPPKDLLLNASFINRAQEMLKSMAIKLKDLPPVIVGTALLNRSTTGKPLFNAAVLLAGGKVTKQWQKTLLPAYDVFDEERYFEIGRKNSPLLLGSSVVGVSICEDIWGDLPISKKRRYVTDPIDTLVHQGANVLINISASPFVTGKQQVRESMLREAAKKHRVPVVYCNQVGGNDDLVFDGRSMAFDASGIMIGRASAFEEDMLVVDLNSQSNRISDDDASVENEAYRALVLGTRDYISKSLFRQAIIGLSGGVDSSLAAVIAAAALGGENVIGVLMPSRYTSAASTTDAQILAQNLGMQTYTLPIDDLMESYQRALSNVFKDYPQDVTEENIQARIRGNILMALSNKFRCVVLSTGNKSELSVGYCTLYGDLTGGLAVLADVPKTLVYRLAAHANKENQVIPQRIIDRAPSAELRPDQKDQDTLPPYDVLDPILMRCIEQHYSVDQVVEEGFDRSMVEQVYRMVETAEFKRRQAPPGIKITDRAFGTGWRMPIVKKYTPA